MRGWDTALDGAQHAHALSDQVDRQRAQIVELTRELEEVRAERDAALGQQTPYGVTPGEFEHDDTVTAFLLWHAIRGELDPCDAWSYDEVGPLLRTFLAVLARRRAETTPDTTPVRQQLLAAFSEDVSEYIAPNEFGGYDVQRDHLADIVLDVVQPYLDTTETLGARLLAETVQRAERLGWRTVSVSRLLALASGDGTQLPEVGGGHGD